MSYQEATKQPRITGSPPSHKNVPPKRRRQQQGQHPPNDRHQQSVQPLRAGAPVEPPLRPVGEDGRQPRNRPVGQRVQ